MVRRIRAAGRVVFVLGLSLSMSACGAGRHADQQLQRLGRVAVLHDAPPGAHLIGMGSDKGNRSGIDGYPPEIVSIFVTSQDVTTIADYYRTHYPQYHLATDFPRAPGTVQMTGREGPPITSPPSIDTAVIGIDIGSGSPYNDTHVRIRIPVRGPNDKTYVLIDAQGYCECGG